MVTTRVGCWFQHLLLHFSTLWFSIFFYTIWTFFSTFRFLTLFLTFWFLTFWFMTFSLTLFQRCFSTLIFYTLFNTLIFYVFLILFQHILRHFGFQQYFWHFTSKNVLSITIIYFDNTILKKCQKKCWKEHRNKCWKQY
jgi:hypothetical protein